MKELGIIGWIALILLIIGGIDSGIYGLFSFHILEVILGTKFNGRFAYILIGLSAVYLIYHAIKQRRSTPQ